MAEAPITFEVGGRPQHSPMVSVKVGDATTNLILDTGSTDHVLTTELADSIGLASKPAESGTDHAGAAVPSRILGDVSIDIGGHAFDLHEAVVIRGPASFAGWGLGGFLSPQHLHPTAHVVIDLVDDTLIVIDGESAAVASWLRSSFPTMRQLSIERSPIDPTVLVNAAIEPFGTVIAMLNTGSGATEFAVQAVRGLRGTSDEAFGRGVGGSEVFGQRVGTQTLRIGQVTRSVPDLVIRPDTGHGHAQGIVGMDVLRGTAVVVSADKSRGVTWLLPRSE